MIGKKNKIGNENKLLNCFFATQEIKLPKIKLLKIKFG